MSKYLNKVFPLMPIDRVIIVGNDDLDEQNKSAYATKVFVDIGAKFDCVRPIEPLYCHCCDDPT